MIGAHPDDCDYDGGGTAILFAKMGYAVKFVSVTNGDAGHQSMGGTALARRRFAEAQEAGKRFGVQYDVLDNHDGQLLPTLDVRLQARCSFLSQEPTATTRESRRLVPIPTAKQ